MAGNPQRLNKNLVDSPFLMGYSQQNQSKPAADRPNMSSVRQGVTPASSNKASAAGGIHGRPVYSSRSGAAQYAKYQKHNKQEYDAYSKQKRKERDYFFVMRKGTCFLMFVLAAVLIAIIALSIVGMPQMDNYIALFVSPDNTLQDERADDYQDASVYISIADPIYGFLGKITGKEMLDANGEPYTFAGNADALAAGAEANPEDSMGGIASILYQYFPAAIIVIALFALVIMIISFAGMLGKRIYKGYGALAIVMLVMSLIVAVAGLAVLGNKSGNPQVDSDGVLVSVLDFSRLVPFFTRIFSGAPAAAVDGAEAIIPVAYAAGYGLLALVAVPLVITVLSLFAKRKVPYSVFDR